MSECRDELATGLVGRSPDVTVVVAASPKRKGKEKRGAAAAAVGKGKKAEVEPIAEDHGPPPPQPGSAEWQFVDRPIDVVRRIVQVRELD